MEVAAKQVGSIALDRLEADLAIVQKQTADGHPSVNSPPAIMFSVRPAVLVYIYGEPHYVSGQEHHALARDQHARAAVDPKTSREPTICICTTVTCSPCVYGPWTVAAQAPDGAQTAEDEARKTGPLDLLEGPKDPTTGERPTLRPARSPDLRTTADRADRHARARTISRSKARNCCMCRIPMPTCSATWRTTVCTC